LNPRLGDSVRQLSPLHHALAIIWYQKEKEVLVSKFYLFGTKKY